MLWEPRLASWRSGVRLARMRLDTPHLGPHVSHRFASSETDSNQDRAKGARTTERDASSTAIEPKANQPAEPSFTTSTSKRAAETDKLPLPYLSRPLGVSGRPTSETPTWLERHPEWFDREVRLEKRKQIVQEATRGYFHDFHEMRSHGGKTWRSPNTMIRHDKALFFPDVMGTCLADRSKKHTADMLFGKVSVVAIMTSKVSEEHTRSFYQATLDRFGDDPNFQLVQINLQENKLKAYLITLFLSTLRAQIPEKLHATYLLSQQSMNDVRHDLGLDNKHVGYTYLVGPDGKIRWAGSAFAEPDESKALVACTAVLLERLASGAGQRAT